MTMIDNPTWTLKDRLRRSRLLAGLEQADVAAQLGVSRATVSTWERGITEPNASNFVRWAQVTGQPLEWLAEGVKCARRDSNPQPSDLELCSSSPRWGIESLSLPRLSSPDLVALLVALVIRQAVRQ